MLSVTIAQPPVGVEAPAVATPAVVAPVVAAPAVAPVVPAVPAKPEARPAELSEKFKDVAALQKAYDDLAKEFTKSRQPATEQTPEEIAAAVEAAKNPDAPKVTGETPGEDKPATETKPLVGYVAEQHAKTPEDTAREVAGYGPAIAGVFDKAGIKAEIVSTEFHTTGKLPDYAYTRLEEAGYSRNVVDSYLRGSAENVATATLAAEQRATGLMDTVGGKTAYVEITGWAQANLSAAEVAAYNKTVNSSDTDVAKAAVAGLKARFEGANGVAPKLLSGSRDSAVDVYQSQAQLTADIRNPKYSRDTAFRAAVEAKALRSTI